MPAMTGIRSADAPPSTTGTSPRPLAPNEAYIPSFLDTLGMAGNSSMRVAADLGDKTGVVTLKDDGTIGNADAKTALTMGGITGTGTAALALRQRWAPNAVGQLERMGYLSRLGEQFKVNGVVIGPALVAAVAGPAVADVMTGVAPHIIGTIRSTEGITGLADQQLIESRNRGTRNKRGVTAAITTSALAGGVYLVAPGAFDRPALRDGVRLPRNTAAGMTEIFTPHRRISAPGMLSLSQARDYVTRHVPSVDAASVQSVRRAVRPMSASAPFTNAVVVAAIGTLATLKLADRAVASNTDPHAKKPLLVAGAGIAATAAATVGIALLTKRAVRGGESSPLRALTKTAAISMPNREWLKNYAKFVLPVTTVPAFIAARKYDNVHDNFGEIVGTDSMFRKDTWYN